MKKYLFLTAATALALASCTNDDYVGGEDLASTDAITFGSKTAAVTRADVGAAAATKLGNSFVVYGWKSYDPKQTVYDHYTVKFADGTANSTTSNTAGWEYVNQTLNILSSLEGEQSIKYWDYTATSYDFIAFSLGQAPAPAAAGTPAVTQIKTGTPTDGQVLISTIAKTSTPVSPDTYTGPKYTITGKLADIAKVYIADRVTAQKTVADPVANRLVAYKDAVQFNFHAATSKVRMGIYETIPGYSVRDVKFYNASGILPDANQAPTLYASVDQKIANSTGVVTATVTFPETDPTKPNYNKAVVELPAGAKSQNMTFGDIELKERDHKEAEVTEYLGRESNTASMCDYVNVFPCTPGALTLKVDYTLVSRDGSGEEIKVVGATAVVPEKFGDWKPNYAYTYLFKISDNTNGTIGGEVGLYPITFDAIVTADEEGNQETITTVATPSITTYQAGKVITTNDEYTAGDIYVTVNGNPALTVGTNANLYTVTVETGAAQGITEESVANALAHGTESPTGTWTVTDANGKKMVVVKSDKLAALTAIPATATPDKKEMTINCGKITASASTIYVFEYINATVKYYKVIKVQ